jgi:ribosomal protein S18 acetylase RimI-like enzyme
LEIALSDHGGQTFKISVKEVKNHDPTLISAVVEIDLLTFSEPTWSRYTAGLLLRHGRTFLLQADDVIIGTSQLLRSWSNPDEAVLFSMSIRPGWRGRGLGTFFLEGISGVLIDSKVTTLMLEVDPENKTAIDLYEKKFGFERQGICRQEYGEGQDRLHLRKVLSPKTKTIKTKLEPVLSTPSEHCEPGPALHCLTDNEEAYIGT